MDISKIYPVILTCARGSDIIRDFTSSYQTELAGLVDFQRPLIQVDVTIVKELDTGYLKSLAGLCSKMVVIHETEPNSTAYASIQQGAHQALFSALEMTEENDYILFLEDDIRFSTRMKEFLSALQFPEGCGMYTLYLPGNGHAVIGKEGEIDAETFFGTQAVLFPRKALQQLKENLNYVLSTYPPGYDIQWSRGMRDLGYTINQAPESYVQHIGHGSMMHPDRFHTSARFVQ